MSYYSVHNGQLVDYSQLPTNSLPFRDGIQRVLPPQISTLHQQICAWGQSSLSPGPLDPQRIWLTQADEMIFSFPRKRKPDPLMHVGAAPDLAAWLVLLDMWMETFVVVARARAIWRVNELASALSFMTPGFLPDAVNALAPNWEQMAHAIALAVADGPFAGAPEDRHWREKN